MSGFPRTTLETVRNRYIEQNPQDGWKFGMVATHTSLVHPDDPKNMLSGSIRWSIEDDPNAACDFRINYPKERLKNGQGYIGTTFRFERPATEGAVLVTGLSIIHGIGNVGLVVPLSASMTETVTNGSEPIVSPICTFTSPTEAGLILAKFGIVE